ncbi:MAG: CDP-alcohol phosphatidyltransferase family protein, partial [Planctomycetales bacterium]|nr:CDP-alcohol phosphatidyltransferase family protein [Planctomycetales bacterium]
MDKHRQAPEPRDEAYRHWIFTLPNVICMVRLLGSLCLLALAVFGFRYAFVGLFVALTLSDWIDGRLARWLHQRSDFGARLDSFADASMYTALLLGIVILSRDIVIAEFPWLAMALSSYLLTTLAGLIKYHRVPSYHTWAAKKSQGLVLLAGITLIFWQSVWPLRLAAVAVTLTNLEATLLTVLLPTWQADVSSLRHV